MSENTSLMTDALHDLCLDLRSALAREAGHVVVAERLAAFAEDASAPGLWQPFAHFAPGHYTRNLIHREEAFELVLLVWDGFQASTIHDHAGQEGWSAVLDGVVEEENFTDRGPGRAPEPGSVGRYHQGQVSHIRDEMGLHRLRAPEAERTVTLHLYAGPVETCRSFGAEDGARSELSLVYHTIHGVAQVEGGLPSRTAWRERGSGLHLPGLPA